MSSHVLDWFITHSMNEVSEIRQFPHDHRGQTHDFIWVWIIWLMGFLFPPLPSVKAALVQKKKKWLACSSEGHSLPTPFTDVCPHLFRVA